MENQSVVPALLQGEMNGNPSQGFSVELPFIQEDRE